MSSDVCTEAVRFARFVLKPLLGEKSVSWDIQSGCVGMRANKARERGTVWVQTAFLREPWGTPSRWSVFDGKVLCQGAAIRAELCS